MMVSKSVEFVNFRAEKEPKLAENNAQGRSRMRGSRALAERIQGSPDQFWQEQMMNLQKRGYLLCIYNWRLKCGHQEKTYAHS
jgi:hypothetical protein